MGETKFMLIHDSWLCRLATVPRVVCWGHDNRYCSPPPHRPPLLLFSAFSAQCDALPLVCRGPKSDRTSFTLSPHCPGPHWSPLALALREPPTPPPPPLPSTPPLYLLFLPPPSTLCCPAGSSPQTLHLDVWSAAGQGLCCVVWAVGMLPL